MSAEDGASIVLGVLRMVKLFGWERKMSKMIKEKRDKELVWIWKDKVGRILQLVKSILTFHSDDRFTQQCHPHPVRLAFDYTIYLFTPLNRFLIPTITMIVTYGTYP